MMMSVAVWALGLDDWISFYRSERYLGSMLAQFFHNSASLGSSAIIKAHEQVGAAQIRIAKVFRFPCKVPKTGCQEEVPTQGFQASFPIPRVPRNRFPRKVPKNRFPRTGSQARL